MKYNPCSRKFCPSTPVSINDIAHDVREHRALGSGPSVHPSSGPQCGLLSRISNTSMPLNSGKRPISSRHMGVGSSVNVLLTVVLSIGKFYIVTQKDKVKLRVQVLNQLVTA
ncbi:hypothetical protein F2P81_019860 [Scophthalmus maximus]|uniref:Uncharacterized protein n=1 Tax=Scophthalmus maximus TaxID=52904 RepID=A0A6A4S3M5_SCOMX|nr:hypothetical protein F2P81_019860 [Scophthalmus maximus]